MAQEAASAKRSLIHAWSVQLDGNESIAQQMALMELYELGEDYFQRYPELIEGVTMESLLDCARTRFAFEQGALIIAGPGQKGIKDER